MEDKIRLTCNLHWLLFSLIILLSPMLTLLYLRVLNLRLLFALTSYFITFFLILIHIFNDFLTHPKVVVPIL